MQTCINKELNLEKEVEKPKSESAAHGDKDPSHPVVKPKSLRGFASMDPATQRAIARKGGKAAHLKGTAHKFTSEEARRAGRKGGEIVSRDSAHMAMIGRKGGEARRGLAARRKASQQKKEESGSNPEPVSKSA
jgi:general stress protein YciG